MPSIPLPEGFVAPEGVAEGDEFDAVGTFVMSGGSLTLKAVDGMAVPGYESDEDEDEDEMDDETGGEDFLSAVERRMSKEPAPTME